jgi:hypothetical protein
MSQTQIQTTGLTDSSVTTTKIADEAVTASKLRDDATTDANRAVTTNHIRDNAVTTAKIADNAVTTAKIADNAVTSAKIPNGAIGTTEIADANITAAKLSGAQTGDAPIYGCRAWVNFDGRGEVSTDQSIRGSGNVSRVRKNADGDYTVFFTTAMPDQNYAVLGTARIFKDETYVDRETVLDVAPRTRTAADSDSVRIIVGRTIYDINFNDNYFEQLDGDSVYVSIFR